MRAILVLCCVAAAILIATVSSSRGDGESTDSTTVAADETTEPITGTASVPKTGDESIPRDPFSPFETGGSAAEWSHDKLTAAEKAVADRGLDEDQSSVQDAYAAASRAMAAQAKADAAATQLGVDDNLDQLGVVP